MPLSYTQTLGLESRVIERKLKFLRRYVKDDEEFHERRREAVEDLVGRAEFSGPEWERYGTYASLYTDMAQYALLVGWKEALIYLGEAAKYHLRAGNRYGTYLASIAGSEEASSADELLFQLERFDAGDGDMVPGLESPVQRLYVLMAALIATDPEDRVAERAGPRLEALRLYGEVRIGKQQRPLAEYIDTVRRLVDIRRERRPFRSIGPDVGRAYDGLRTIHEFGQDYGRGLVRARQDSFHWKRLALSFELIDFDLVGLVRLVLPNAEIVLQLEAVPGILEDRSISGFIDRAWEEELDDAGRMAWLPTQAALDLIRARG